MTLFKISLKWDEHHRKISFRGVLEVKEAVIYAVDTDKWRSKFYDLKTLQEIANHIAYNLLVNRLLLSEMDGFADQKDDSVSIEGNYKITYFVK